MGGSMLVITVGNKTIQSLKQRLFADVCEFSKLGEGWRH